MKSKYKFASWMMSELCNFDCRYCHSHRPSREKKLLYIDDLIRTLLQAHPYWTVGMTGGEPFLYPGFIEVCRKLTDAGIRIAVDTNLSVTHLIKKFSETISPKSVEYIYSSAHAVEREKIYGFVDQYIANIKLLQKKGFPVQASYVMHPSLFDRFICDRKLFARRGITLEPKPFNGIYKGRLYPAGYNQDQKKLILSHDAEAFKRTTFHSKGLKCRTGMDMVRIWPDGRISRCVADTKPIGYAGQKLNLFSNPRPCAVGWCPCFGWEYVTDKITKDRIRENLGDNRLSLWEIITTPRVWKKAAYKISRWIR